MASLDYKIFSSDIFEDNKTNFSKHLQNNLMQMKTMMVRLYTKLTWSARQERASFTRHLKLLLERR